MTTQTREKEKKTSRILDAVHETARGLRTAGFVSKRRMKDYDALCTQSLQKLQPSASPASERTKTEP